MDSVVVRLLVIGLTPAAVAGAAVWLPRAARALRAARRAPVLPVGPPLEQVAADLRRLIAEHERVRRSPDLAVRAARLTVLEAAVSDCALDAARSLGLALPGGQGRAPLRREQLVRLLDELADAGLVLPVRGTWSRLP